MTSRNFLIVHSLEAARYCWVPIKEPSGTPQGGPSCTLETSQGIVPTPTRCSILMEKYGAFREKHYIIITFCTREDLYIEEK